MRTIGEIQAAVRDDRGNSEGLYLAASSEELRLCVESQRILLEATRDALHDLIATVHLADAGSYLEDEANDAWKVCDRVYKSAEMTPEEVVSGPKTGFDPKTPG